MCAAHCTCKEVCSLYSIHTCGERHKEWCILESGTFLRNQNYQGIMTNKKQLKWRLVAKKVAKGDPLVYIGGGEVGGGHCRCWSAFLIVLPFSRVTPGRCSNF